MREIRTEIEIQASAPRVWAALTDFARYPQWNPFIRKAEGEVREGERLSVRLEPPGGWGMTFAPRVTRVEPERRFQWLGHLFVRGLFDGEHTFEIEPLGRGRVRFVQREAFRGVLVPLLWPMLEESTRAGFEAMNAALKRRAEKDAA